MIFCTLKSLMEDYGVTQTRLSEATGITRPTLVQLMKNENQNIKYDTIDKLCEFFNIELDELIKKTKYEIKYSGSQLKSTEYQGTPYFEVLIIIDDIKFIFQGYKTNSLIELICDVEPRVFMKYFTNDIDEEIFKNYLKAFNIKQRIISDIGEEESKGIIFKIRVLDNKKVIINLKDVLNKKGLSIKEIHEKTGISRNTLSMMANDKTNGIQFDTLASLLEVLDCTVSELIEYTNIHTFNKIEVTEMNDIKAKIHCSLNDRLL